MKSMQGDEKKRSATAEGRTMIRTGVRMLIAHLCAASPIRAAPFTKGLRFLRGTIRSCSFMGIGQPLVMRGLQKESEERLVLTPRRRAGELNHAGLGSHHLWMAAESLPADGTEHTGSGSQASMSLEDHKMSGHELVLLLLTSPTAHSLLWLPLSLLS